MNATPPPGWYPDNLGPGLRYWDGQRWTEHTAPGGSDPSSGHPSPATVTPLGGANKTSQQNWFLRHKVLSGVGAFVLLMTIVGAIGSQGDVATPAAADTSVDGGGDSGGDASPTPEPVDTDGDGVTDEVDFRPTDPKIQTRDDLDTDRDGVSDGDDYRPKDPKIQTRDDVDTDHDKVPDYKDDFPRDPNFSKDTDGDLVPDQLDAFPKDARYSKDTDNDGVADAEDAFPSDPSRSKVTLAMENALESARNYLSFSPFSRQGLIDQLSSNYGEGYDLADATWAVSQLKVDWREQAVRSAKSYLEMTSFSRRGLIDQLSSAYGEKYTLAEAIYAVDKIGL
ncbi:Ltp family lipoprotein [Nocardioides sp. LS1]|uniref:Ltp family lipoprotein n=1 Tax=Nocardioides sp. LS1 TaxID=1027620 RepID=UPI000F627D24|nr:Ltp family lipoprotein [Nocardioides sp. LS1]GCD89924.1 hypothetical protein NLS1_19300 [Nocardioides sp. LS1]